MANREEIRRALVRILCEGCGEWCPDAAGSGSCAIQRCLPALQEYLDGLFPKDTDGSHE